jgi:PAS domain-containing protein
MLLTTAALHVTLLALSAVTTATLGAYAYRHRQEPGATPFVALMAALTVWSGGYAVALLTPDYAWRLFWERVQWFGTETLHVWLLLFALTYTGHDGFVTRRTLALLAVVPVTTTLLVWTNPLHHLMWAEPRIVGDGLALLDLSYGPAFWLNAMYAYALIAVASALLVRLAFVSDYLYADQSALLGVGIATPFVANVVDVLILTPGVSVDYTPYAFTVTGVAFGYALFSRRLFDLVPATRQLGRSAAIGQLDAGVVIVDNARRVVYCNEAAGEVLDCEPADTLGREARTLVDDVRIDFGAEDALAEIERDGDVFEVRTSAIADRRDRRIGHTLVIHDVTARKTRERRLAEQRDELATLEDLNTVVRSVNQALVSATTREGIERALCARVVEADLYRTACAGDVATWTGDADRWVVAGGDGSDPTPPGLDDDRLTRAELTGRGPSEAGPGPGTDAESGPGADMGSNPGPESGPLPIVPETDGSGGTWAVVPLVYGRTVYGALGLYTDREAVGERERVVLGELGETVGHAINAVETRRLLSAEAVVELTLESDDGSDPLAAASAGSGYRLDVTGLVPGRDGGQVAYVGVEGDELAAARDRLATATTGTVRTIRDGGTDGLLEWRATGESLLGSLSRLGANVLRAHAEDGRTRYELETASDADVRALLDHVDGQFPGTKVVAKRERTRPVERAGALPGERLDDLTDRQREAIEAAFRAGYFEWPRDSTAEDVADSLGVSSPTLHSHLRKAEKTLLSDLFDPDARRE